MAEGADDKSASVQPKAWWQWVLVYPTLIVSLLTAVPAWMDKYQAYKLGINSSALAAANEQNQLWQANLECTKSQEFQRVTNQHNIEVGAHVCPSGDLLVFIKHPNAIAPQYRWVGIKTFQLTAGSLSSPSVAYAASPETVLAQAGATVIKQKMLKPGTLKQRLRNPNGECVDVVINTYTGAVVSQLPVPCDSPF